MPSKMNAEGIKVGGYQIVTLMLLSINLFIVAMSHGLSIFYKYTPKFYCQESSSRVLLGTPNISAASVSAIVAEAARNRSYGCSGVGHSCPGGYAFELDEPDRRLVVNEWQLVCERDYLLRLAADAYFAGLLLGGVLAGLLSDRIGRLPVLAICLYAQGTMAVALNCVQDYHLFILFRGLQGFFMQGLESCTYIICLELLPARFRTLAALAVLSMRSVGLALLSGLNHAIRDWRILQLVVSVPTALSVFYIWIMPESPRWLLAKGKLTEAEILLERIVHYNGMCGARGGNGKDPESDVGQEDDDGREMKPQKPKRRRNRANSSESAASTLEHRVEKPADESNSLLICSNVEPTDRANVEQEMISMNIEKESIRHIESDVEEAAKDSFLAEDEKNEATDNKKEANADDDGGCKKEKSRRNLCRDLFRFLESKFIGRTCVILMLLWFVSSLAFHSLIGSHRMSLDRHVSLTVAAGVEIATFVLAYLLISSPRCGRRSCLCLAQIVVGSACLAIAVLAIVFPKSTVSWLALVQKVTTLTGRVMNIGCFFTLRLVTIELFPTVSRGTGLGLCIAAEMLAGLLMPYFLLLNGYVLESSRFIVGSLCICFGFVTLIFPETLRAVLPDTAEEARKIGQTWYNLNDGNDDVEQSSDPEVLREKLFSEDWVDAGNGIIVNFTDKNIE